MFSQQSPGDDDTTRGIPNQGRRVSPFRADHALIRWRAIPWCTWPPIGPGLLTSTKQAAIFRIFSRLSWARRAERRTLRAEQEAESSAEWRQVSRPTARIQDTPVVRPWAIAVRKLLTNLAQGRQDILEFHGFARG